jgi:hypothetical protein
MQQKHQSIDSSIRPPLSGDLLTLPMSVSRKNWFHELQLKADQ